MNLTWNSYVTSQKHTVKCIVKRSTNISVESFGNFGQLVQCSFTNDMVLDSRLLAVTSTSDFAPASSNEKLNIQTTTDYGFNLKFVPDMTKT